MSLRKVWNIICESRKEQVRLRYFLDIEKRRAWFLSLFALLGGTKFSEYGDLFTRAFNEGLEESVENFVACLEQENGFFAPEIAAFKFGLLTGFETATKASKPKSVTATKVPQAFVQLTTYNPEQPN